ncbi:unnamed protein product [Paramecium sonneborni]|uniref:Uncharacterized protein n=1 Tax=Paramecium sonneborni TaxID=65129 RepID=A0A8S1KP52_9CILI|nr:unnamed protein product [Paramecium sonneborni]
MRPKESDMYKRIKILGQRSLEKQIYLNIQKAILFVYEQEKIVFRIERKFRKLVKSLEQWLNQKMYKTVKGELYLVMNNQGLDQIIEEGTKIMNQGVLSFPKIFIKNQQKYTRFIQLDQNQKKNKDKNQKKQLKNQFIKFMIKQNCRNNSLKNQEKEKHLKKQKNLFIISNIIRSIIIIRRNCGNCRIKIFRQKNCSERFIKFKEQQQIQQKVETAAFDFQPQLQFQVFDVTQKKPIKQNKPSNSQRDEEKKLKKIIKQYIRIPFIKKPQIIQKRNSENDMQEMINEFKIVLVKILIINFLVRIIQKC